MRRGGEGLLGQLKKLPGAEALRLVKLRQIQNGNPRQSVRLQPLGFQQPLRCLLGNGRVNGQQLGGGGNQLVPGQKAVTGGEIVPQLKQQPRLCPPGVVRRHPQGDGEVVHRPEGGIQPLIHEKIGVIIKQGYGVFPVEFVDLHRQLTGQVVESKKFQQLPHPHLEPEALPDGLGLGRGDSRHL